MNKFIVPATLPDNGIKSLADKSWRVTFDTQELTQDQGIALLELKGGYGVLGFAPVLKESDLDIDDELMSQVEDTKSPSQRQRAIIWQIWKNTTNQSKPFAEFYLSFMDKLSQSLKDKYL